MKLKHGKDVKRRITDQLAIQRIAEEARGDETPHEWEEVAAVMSMPRRVE